MLEPFTHPSLPVVHGFFTRKGGVSSGLYSGLNVGRGSADDPDNVEQNRRRVAAHLGGMQLISLHQTHSNIVHALEAGGDLPDMPPQGDALITNRDDISIGVLSADCVPVLFFAPQAGWVGAAHAGWRGALCGIVDNTVKTLKQHAGLKTEIRAVVGPCISVKHYEIDTDFKETFIRADEKNANFFTPATRTGHSMFDLSAFVTTRCQLAGCHQVSRIDMCTYDDQERFFSYRRSCHRNEPDYGRQISAISLKEL